MAEQHFLHDAKLPEVVIQHKDACPFHMKVLGEFFRIQGGFPVGRRKEKQDDKFAALPFSAFHTDGAAHPGDLPGADGKAEAETGYATGILQPLEGGEYPLRVLFIHAGARIPDAQMQLLYSASSRTLPSLVNFKAFESRLLTICWRWLLSPQTTTSVPEKPEERSRRFLCASGA